MPTFRKKPIVVEAVQYRREFHTGCGELPPGVERHFCRGEDGELYETLPIVQTLEGELRVADGDWIIKGVKGEFYPCKPDIFEATYEPCADLPDTAMGVMMVVAQKRHGKRLGMLVERMCPRCKAAFAEAGFNLEEWADAP